VFSYSYHVSLDLITYMEPKEANVYADYLYIAIMEGPTADLNNATCYLEGIGGLLAKITPEGIVACYYHDALGNTGAMADGLGNLTDTQSRRESPYFVRSR